MHDCAWAKEQLIDLVFDEAPDAARLRAEVESCPECRAELRALDGTLLAYERATDADRQPEDFWAGYHARLAARLAASDLEAGAAPHRPAAARDRREPSTEPFSTPTGWLLPSPDSRGQFTPLASGLPSHAARLRRALATTWRVPAPAVLAAALLVVCLSIFALVRPAPVAVESPALADSPVAVRTVEVPAVRDRIVTRTVYVARGAGSRATRPARAVRIEEARDAQRVRVVGDAQSGALALALAGFRPASDAKLRVIKGSYANDK
jgi:hypothetical protein